MTDNQHGALDCAQAVELVLAASASRSWRIWTGVERICRACQTAQPDPPGKALTKLSLDTSQSLNQFAHPSELVFARLLDFYGIRWSTSPVPFRSSKMKRKHHRGLFARLLSAGQRPLRGTDYNEAVAGH